MLTVFDMLNNNAHFLFTIVYSACELHSIYTDVHVHLVKLCLAGVKNIPTFILCLTL